MTVLKQVVVYQSAARLWREGELPGRLHSVSEMALRKRMYNDFRVLRSF